MAVFLADYGLREVVEKHGSHNQKTHGRKGSGKGSSGSPRAGMGDIKLTGDMAADMKGGSAEKHLVKNEDGSYSFTPERQALHDEIINKQLDGVPESKDPTFTIMGGGPAAGKSTLINSGKAEGVPTGKQATQINPDTLKEELPDWESMGNSTKKAGFTHEESSYLAKRQTAAAIERKTDMVLDGTGDTSAASMGKKIDAARSAGYKVNGVYVTMPTEKALAGALDRAKTTGRYVSEDVIRMTHTEVSRVFPALTDKFDSLKLFDTTNLFAKGEAILLGSGTGGKFNILDKAGYQAFLDKGK